MELNARIALEEVQQKEVDVCRCGLTRPYGHLEEGLNDPFVIDQEMYVFIVNNVVMRGEPCQGTFQGSQLRIKGGGSQGPVHMLMLLPSPSAHIYQLHTYINCTDTHMY